MQIALQKWFLLMLVVFFSVGFFIFVIPPIFAAQDPCEEYKNVVAQYNKMTDEEQEGFLGLSLGEKLKNLGVQCSMQKTAEKQNAAVKTPPVGEEKLHNPLGTKSIHEFIGRLIKFAFGLAGSAALLMFVWGGLQYILSAGDDNKVKKGKETIKYAAFGLVIMFVSYTLINALIVALQSGTVT